MVMPEEMQIADFNQKNPLHSQWQQVLEQRAEKTTAIYLASKGLEFSLLEMMILVTLAGVGFSLITHFGLVGGFLAFNLSVLLTWLISSYSRKPANIRMQTQIIWVVLMPVFCLMSDPLLFAEMKNGVPVTFNESTALPAYSLHLLMFAVLGFSFWLRSDSLVQLNSLVAGVLMGGSLFFLLIGLTLIPLILIGSLAGVGLLGLSPWITALVLAKTSAMHYRWAASKSGGARLPLWVLGMAIPIFVWFRLRIWAQEGEFQEFYVRLLQAFASGSGAG